MSEYQKRISVGAFAKKGIDYKDGDKVVVLNEGKQVVGQFGEQDVFLVRLPNGEEKNMTFNQTSINGLIDAYGKDSKEWINKEVRVHLVNQNVAGKFLKVTYISHPEAELTENGFVLDNALKSGDAEADADSIPF